MAAITLQCAQCHNDFTYVKKPGQRSKYCSDACRETWIRERYGRSIPGFYDRSTTSTCAHCGNDFTYEKTTGRLRMYCNGRCKMNAGAAKAAERNKNQQRVCECGSTDVPKAGKPVCRICRKDDRDRAEYNRTKRLRMYGLTSVQFDEILALQRGKCAICETDTPGGHGWMIDHDHACCRGLGSCGACVRGILCHSCNIALGNLNDSTNLLRNAIKYLEVNSQFKLRFEVIK